MGLLVTLFIVWIFFVIITNRNKKTKTSNMNIKHTNNISSNEGIIYPIHIKYKMPEKNEALYPTNSAYSSYIKDYPTYRCIVDNEIMTGISVGQETELDIAPGEHIIFFETHIIRNKIKNK